MESVTLEVRKSNLLAQALYEKYRFLKVGVRKRYYSDNHEDAIIMTTPPIQHESYRSTCATCAACEKSATTSNAAKTRYAAGISGRPETSVRPRLS